LEDSSIKTVVLKIKNLYQETITKSLRMNKEEIEQENRNKKEVSNEKSEFMDKIVRDYRIIKPIGMINISYIYL